MAVKKINMTKANKFFIGFFIIGLLVWYCYPNSDAKIEADKEAYETSKRSLEISKRIDGGYVNDEQKVKDDAYQKEKDERKAFKRRLNWALEHSKED